MSTLSYEASCPITAVEPRKAEQSLLILLQLVADLKLVQTRLGTSQEESGDYERAHDLGHTIRNKLQVLQIWDSLGFVDLPPHLKNLYQR